VELYKDTLISFGAKKRGR